jgi:hypothetical protein
MSSSFAYSCLLSCWALASAVLSRRLHWRNKEMAPIPSKASRWDSFHTESLDGSNIWVANAGDDNVTKLRASDATVLGTFSVGYNPLEIAFDGANVWITNASDVSVTRLRESDGAPRGTFTVGEAPNGIVFDGANMWVAN